METAMDYLKSIEIEHFLKGILNPRQNSKESGEIQGLYHSIMLYENGYGALSTEEHKEEVKRLLKYFEKAMDKLINEENSELINELKAEMTNIKSSKDFLALYLQLKNLRIKQTA